MTAMERVAAFGSRSTISGWAAISPSRKSSRFAHHRVHRRPDYPASLGLDRWSNCIWDGLAILALLCLDGTVSTACPSSGQPLLVTAADGALVNPRGVVHFVVPAR